MMQWWHATPIRQRFVICGIAIALCVLGMYVWVWSSLDRSMVIVAHELDEMNQKNQKAVRSIAALGEVERKVLLLRQEISQTVPPLSGRVEPQAFRRAVANIGKRTGVTIRLWKSQKSLMDREQPHDSLDIIVRVEGSFPGTVQFLNTLLSLSWIQTVNPLVLSRKQGTDDAAMVTTDFTIRSVGYKNFQQIKEL
jgi:Tfp pilus assembly protein PilO